MLGCGRKYAEQNGLHAFCPKCKELEAELKTKQEEVFVLKTKLFEPFDHPPFTNGASYHLEYGKAKRAVNKSKFESLCCLPSSVCPFEKRKDAHTAVIVETMGPDQTIEEHRFCAFDHFGDSSGVGVELVNVLFDSHQPPAEDELPAVKECKYNECPLLYDEHNRKTRSKPLIPEFLRVYPRDKPENTWNYCSLTCLIDHMSAVTKTEWKEICKNSVPAGRGKKKVENQRSMSALLKKKEKTRRKSSTPANISQSQNE